MSIEPEINHDVHLHELVLKAAQGDSAAFGLIYDKYFDKIYRFIFYRVNHRETAEDLVAETFVRVWNKMPKIKDARSFNGWVYQIARNLVIDYYRAKKEILDIDDLENILEYEDTIIDTADLDFKQKQFLSALKLLPADQQTVIKLKFLEELENSEIASILKKSEGAVRVIQHRALNELKKLINGEVRS